LVEEVVVYFCGLAVQHEISAEDLRLWREVAGNPAALLDDPISA
jgi:hypothetical protein